MVWCTDVLLIGFDQLLDSLDEQFICLDGPFSCFDQPFYPLDKLVSVWISFPIVSSSTSPSQQVTLLASQLAPPSPWPDRHPANLSNI